MPKDSLIGKTQAELNNELIKFKKESMNLRFQKSMGQLEKPSRIKVVRREIARIKTILNKKENNA